MDTNKIKGRLLLASVFVTGTAVLIVQIVAMRILSPHYGNTIYTTSSVIGIMLAALSLGYYLGGKLSDRYPAHKFFYFIIFISGLLVIVIQILNKFLLPILGYLLPITIGPIISSLFLFLIPSLLFGLLSPYAIKLNKKDSSPDGSRQDKVGSQSGEVFFWSTIGSVTGSFASGFFLIPHFGISTIIIGTGITLSLWGLVGFLFFEKFNKKTIFFIFLFILLIFLAYMPISQKDSNVLYEKDGIYEKIKISDGEWNKQPTRFLFLDKSHSSAMYLNSNELVFDYTKYYALYQLFNSNAKNAFVIGGGAYSIPNALLNDSPDIKVDVSEIEPELFELAKKYFKLQDSNRLTNYVEDGRRFLNLPAQAGKTPKKYDVIVSDVYYSFFSIPIHFTTKEFFSLAKSRLSDKGVFVGNFAGSLNKNQPSFILSEIKTFKNIFPNSYFFAVNSPEIEAPQNIIFLGINGSQKIDFNSELILKSDNPIIKNLSQKNIDLNKFELSKYQELTDNFSPVEYMVNNFINRWY